jgi:carboxypeptidase C (cathepsin A)
VSRAALAAAALGLALAAAPAAAAPAQVLRPGEEPAVVTEHRMTLDGRAVTYRAEIGRLAIRDVGTGEPHGEMGYVAFRLAPTAGRPRPVMFIWNGGPGAPSATLDFEVAGPKRLVAGRLVDNPQSWLAAADLVFVDPIGTGFSRPTRAEYGEEFYGTVGDVASVAEFVRAWRVSHEAEDAPLFLAGESWGAGRAGSVGYALQKRGIAISGLVLISGGAGLNHRRLPAAESEALRVVDMAEAARANARLDPALGSKPEAVRRAAEAWARATYAPALADPAALSPAQREAVAAGLARFTGLPPERIDRASLRVTPRQFRTELVPGHPRDLFDLRRPAGGAEPDAAPILDFLRTGLGFATTLPYLGLQPLEAGYAPGGRYPPEVNARWNYATEPMTPEQVAAAIAEATRTGAGPPRLGAPLPSVEELAALDPGVKVLVAAGRYDSLNSCAANAELAGRLPAPLARAIRFRCYAGGHMMYRDEAARLALGADVAALVRSAGR